MAADMHPSSPAMVLRSPGHLVERLVDLAIDATGCDRAGLFLLDEETAALVAHLSRRRTERAIEAGTSIGWPTPRHASRLLDEPLTSGIPAEVADTRAAWNLPASWRETIAPGSALILPLVAGEDHLGLLVLGWEAPGSVNPHVRPIAVRAAESVAATLGGVVEAECERSLAVERERVLDGLREPLARVLSAINLRAGLVRLVVDDALAADAAEIEVLARRGLTALRRAEAGLMALRSEPLDLPSALQRLADEFESRHPVVVDVEVAATDAIDDVVADALLVAVHEALSNIERHAEAAAVRLALDIEDGVARLSVSDDGLGLGRHGDAPMGMGLELVRRALEPLGGRVELRDRAPGTELIVTAPLAAPLPAHR